MSYPIIRCVLGVLVLAVCSSCSRAREEEAARPAQAPSPAALSPASGAAPCSVPLKVFARSLRTDVPASLAEAGRLLNEALSDEAKAYLVCEPESDEAIAALHFSAGRTIRNRWLYGPKGEKLMSELKGLGVTTRDGGSAAVILSARSILRPQAKP